MTISTTTMVLLLLLQLRQPSALALGHNVTRAGIHIYDDDDDDDNIIYTQTHFCAGEQLALRRARAVLDKTSRAAREGETEKERETEITCHTPPSRAITGTETTTTTTKLLEPAAYNRAAQLSRNFPRARARRLLLLLRRTDCCCCWCTLTTGVRESETGDEEKEEREKERRRVRNISRRGSAARTACLLRCHGESEPSELLLLLPPLLSLSTRAHRSLRVQ